MNKCKISDLEKMTFDKHIKPYRFYADGIDEKIDNWSDLCLIFVKWLNRNGLLPLGKLPVPNYAGRGKDFINMKPQHTRQEMNGYWKNIGPYYIDTKYNADAHVRNILSTLRHLGIIDPQLQLSFHVD
ncbi:MAG: hypothetical protein M0Q01_01560 [Syntrophales bacterium]|jgi:hypothetical protein|nr:hypothetical protein [Syntrophales bacterium]